MLTQLFKLYSAVLCLVLIQACGVPGPGGASEPGDGGTTKGVPPGQFVPDEVISVSIEANQTTSGLADIATLSPTAISIVGLNSSFREIRAPSAPDYRVVQKKHGIYDIEFDALYVEQANVVVRVKFSNGTILYAPIYSLESSNQTITVSAKSHYVLKKLFDTINSQTELDQLLPCTSNTNNCPNQYQAKSSLLKYIARAAQAYEITIPDNINLSATLNLFDQNLDFKTQVETAVKELSRTTSPIAKGTPRIVTSLDGSVRNRLTYEQEYNSLWFSLSLSKQLVNDKVIVGAASSKIVAANEGENKQPIYPVYYNTTELLDLRRESLTTDINFSRSSLAVDELKQFSFIPSEPDNSFSFLLSDGLMSTQGFVLNNQIMDQSIPSPIDGVTIGWQFNPISSRLYRVNDYEPEDTLDDITVIDDETPDYGVHPTWLIGANHSTAASYRLSNTNKRVEQLEDLNLFSWELHGLKTDTQFSTSAINGKKYGVLSYSLKLSDSDDVLALFGETLRWDAVSNRLFDETQPTDHYQSHVLTRSTDNSARGWQAQLPVTLDDHAYYTIQTEGSNRENPFGYNEIQGLLGLDGGARAPYGHSTQNGKHLAFVFDTLNRGRGIEIATELRPFSAIPIFSGERYQLQGNHFKISDTTNTLSNINGSTLTLTDRLEGDSNDIECHANLTIKGLKQEHTVGNNTLTTPTTLGTTIVTSTSCKLGNPTPGSQSGSEIELRFNNVFGQPLALKGFVTQTDAESPSFTPGRLINLLWIQDDTLGLVFANLEQSLSSSFE